MSPDRNLTNAVAGSTASPAFRRRELEQLFGRPVDIVYRRVIEHDPNYIIRRSVLDAARVIYAA